MKKVSLIANAVLFLLLLTAIVYAFVQQAEAAVANAKHAIEASMEADLCKREAAALQAEAAKQRELAEQHLRGLEQALARCKGK